MSNEDMITTPTEPPPQIVRTVNLLDVPDHDISGPEDADGIADFILSRAKEGTGDIFAHEDYDRCSGDNEAFARGAPFCDAIEPLWCVNSACDVPSKNAPDNRPLLDVSCDIKGNAKMMWSPSQGLHDRPHVGDWSPEREIRST